MSSSSANQLGVLLEMPAKQTLDSDLAMILQLTFLVDLIQKRPVERIAPYAEEFRVLSNHFETLSRRLGVTRESSNNPSTGEQPQLSSFNRATPLLKAVRYQQSAVEALQGAIRSIPSVLKAVTAINNVANLERHWLEQDWRIAHLRPIHRLQKRKDSQTVLAHDRLLLILSCNSLAQDFQCFERSNGWVPKEDQLIERISNGQDPSTQSIGKHLQNFLSSHSTLPADREKMDAGVRLGTKLRVLDAMVNSFGVGSALSLLLGFEYQKFSRLSYNAFAALKQSLDDNEEQRRIIQNFSETTGTWFQDCLAHYHKLYNSLSTGISPPICGGLQVTSASSFPDSCLLIQYHEISLPAQAAISPGSGSVDFAESIHMNVPVQPPDVPQDFLRYWTQTISPIDVFSSGNFPCNGLMSPSTLTTCMTEHALGESTSSFHLGAAALPAVDSGALPPTTPDINKTILDYSLLEV